MKEMGGEKGEGEGGGNELKIDKKNSFYLVRALNCIIHGSELH